MEAQKYGGEKNGVGQVRDGAVDLRTLASMAIGFFAVHCSSGIAQLVTPDVEVNASASTVSFRAVRQKRDKLGVGQLAY